MTSKLSQKHTCSCPCGATKFDILDTPITRFYCHCLICQTLYKQPFADFTVISSSKVNLHNTSTIEFGRYRRPPALRRGICKTCQQPAIGFLRLAPFIELAFIASNRYPKNIQLPDAQAHIFYHRRTTSIEDNLPKHAGYLKSEWAVCAGILSSVLRK